MIRSKLLNFSKTETHVLATGRVHVHWCGSAAGIVCRRITRGGPRVGPAGVYGLTVNHDLLALLLTILTDTIKDDAIEIVTADHTKVSNDELIISKNHIQLLSRPVSRLLKGRNFRTPESFRIFKSKQHLSRNHGVSATAKAHDQSGVADHGGKKISGNLGQS